MSDCKERFKLTLDYQTKPNQEEVGLIDLTTDWQIKTFKDAQIYYRDVLQHININKYPENWRHLLN